MPIHIIKDDNRKSGLRTYGPWIIGAMIIIAAAFYTQDELRGIYRDIVDIVSGWMEKRI